MMDRRHFLDLAGAGAAAAGLGACSFGGDDDVTPAGDAATGGTDAQRAAADATTRSATDRVLVLLDLQGGSDGLSTLVPHADDAYFAARPTLAVPGEQVLALDTEVGLHPRLARLHARGVTTVEGVGPVDGNLSHFSMQARWEQGDPRGRRSGGDGFLARLVRNIDHGPDELVGVSVGGQTPHFNGSLANTLTMATSTDLWFLAPSAWWRGPASLVDGLAALSSTTARGDRLGATAASYGSLLDIAARLDGVDNTGLSRPAHMDDGGELAQRLRAAAELIVADVGVRVVYAQLPGWDTHQGHLFAHDNLLRILDASVDGFLQMMDDAGWGDRVLVATTTEFGRRVAENGTGFDHGTSSAMFLFGQGDRGRFGDRPSLTSLDDDGNPAVTVGFDRYLATLAEEWLGLDAAAVLESDEVTTLGVF